MIFSWDPGEVRTGCCMFRYDAESKKADLRIIRILNNKEVYEVLELAEHMLKPGEQHTFVIENFRADVMNVANRSVRGRNMGATFQWSEMKTSQMIGTLTYAAYRMNKSPVILQEPTVLTMGRVWCDLKVPQKGHIPDDKSAYIHGAHYMMKQQMIGSVEDIIKAGQERLL